MGRRLRVIIITGTLVLILLLVFLGVGILKDRQDTKPALSSLPRFQQSNSTNLASEQIGLIEDEGYKNIYLDTSNCLPSVDWRLLARLAPGRNAALALGSPDASNICKFALAHYWGDQRDQEGFVWSIVSLYKLNDEDFSLTLAVQKGYILKDRLESRQVQCWLWAVGEKQLEKYCENPPMPSRVETSSEPTVTQPPALFANIEVPSTLPLPTPLPSPLPLITPIPTPVLDWDFEVVVKLGDWSGLQRHLDVQIINNLAGGVFPAGFSVQYPQGVLVPAGSVVQVTARVSYQGSEYQVVTKTRSSELIAVGSFIDYKPPFWTRQKVYWVTSADGANIRIMPFRCRLIGLDPDGTINEKWCDLDKWVIVTFSYHELVTIYTDGARGEAVGIGQDNNLWWPVDLGGTIYYVHNSVVAPYQPPKPKPLPTQKPWVQPTLIPTVTPVLTVTPLVPLTTPTPTPLPLPEASPTWAPPTVAPSTTPVASDTPNIEQTIAFMETLRAPTSTPLSGATPTGEVSATQTPTIESSLGSTNQMK